MDAELPARAQLLLDRSAGEAQPALVDEGDEATRVGGPDHHRGGVGQIAEACLRLAQRLLHRPALVDVGGRTHVTRELALGEARGADLEHPAIPASDVHQPVLVAELLAPPKRVVPARQQLGPVIGMGAHPERVAELLVERSAREALPTRVDEGHVTVGVGHPHESRGGVRQLAEARLALAHQLVVARTLDRQGHHVGYGVEEVDVVVGEVAPACGCGRRSRRSGSRARRSGPPSRWHPEVALLGRGPEAALDGEVLDHHGLLGLQGVTQKRVRAGGQHAARPSPPGSPSRPATSRPRPSPVSSTTEA